MAPAIDHHGGPPTVRLPGDHARQVPAGWCHDVPAQFHHEPRRRGLVRQRGCHLDVAVAEGAVALVDRLDHTDRPLPRRHRHGKDALRVRHLAVDADGNLRLEANRGLDKCRCGSRVERNRSRKRHRHFTQGVRTCWHRAPPPPPAPHRPGAALPRTSPPRRWLPRRTGHRQAGCGRCRDPLPGDGGP